MRPDIEIAREAQKRPIQEIGEKRGLCYTIYASVGSYDDTGMLTIYAGTSGKDLPELVGLTVDSGEFKMPATFADGVPSPWQI